MLESKPKELGLPVVSKSNLGSRSLRRSIVINNLRCTYSASAALLQCASEERSGRLFSDLTMFTLHTLECSGTSMFLPSLTQHACAHLVQMS